MQVELLGLGPRGCVYPLLLSRFFPKLYSFPALLNRPLTLQRMPLLHEDGFMVATNFAMHDCLKQYLSAVFKSLCPPFILVG